MKQIIEKLLRGEALTGAERLALAIQCLGIREAVHLIVLDAVA
jgi:hypothetical protein